MWCTGDVLKWGQAGDASFGRIKSGQGAGVTCVCRVLNIHYTACGSEVEASPSPAISVLLPPVPAAPAAAAAAVPCLGHALPRAVAVVEGLAGCCLERSGDGSKQLAVDVTLVCCCRGHSARKQHGAGTRMGMAWVLHFPVFSRPNSVRNPVTLVWHTRPRPNSHIALSPGHSLVLPMNPLGGEPYMKGRRDSVQVRAFQASGGRNVLALKYCNKPG